MSNRLVTRDALRNWGFIRLPDTWLYSSSYKRKEYFETWYHTRWNYRVHPGYPEADPLVCSEQEFEERVADHLAEESGEMPLFTMSSFSHGDDRLVLPSARDR